MSSGSREEVNNFRDWTDRLLETGTVGDVVFVCGNHECSMECTAKIPAARRAQEELKASLTERPRVHYLEDSMCEIKGLRFYGSPWTTRCGRDWAFQKLDSEATEPSAPAVRRSPVVAVMPQMILW